MSSERQELEIEGPVFPFDTGNNDFSNPYILMMLRGPSRPSADRQTPEWAQPVAPLAEWLKRADKLLS